MAFENDFFISRRGADAAYAQEVADILTDAGHKVCLQDRDIQSGDNFVERMDTFLRQARDLVVILTPNYMESGYTRAEIFNFLAAALSAQDERRLYLVKCRECEPGGVLEGTVFVDLVEIQNPKERQRIVLEAIGHRTLTPGLPTKIFHGVPERLHLFAGREELIVKLRSDLIGPGDDTGGSTAVTQALAGMGGVGKTMLAAEYAHRHRGTYAGVWWAQAESRTVLEASLAELAGQLDPLLAKTADQAAAAQAALSYLDEQASLLPWLLVYDNVETPMYIDGLRPAGCVHLIVTTRFSAWPGARNYVGLFPRTASIVFLQERAERKDDDGADRLAEHLGDLPLALDHAAAYCHETGITFAEYFEHLDGFLAERPESAVYRGRHNDEQTVSSTFALALERAAERSPHAERLLGLLSVLGAEPIPLDLFDKNIMSVPERAEAVGALNRFGLLLRTEAPDKTAAVAVHRLVALVARNNGMVRDRFFNSISQATKLLAKRFPDAYREPALWPRCAALLPHILALRTRWTKDTIPREAVELLRLAGTYLHGRASYGEAEPLYREAIKIGEEVLGRSHPEVAHSINNLALLLKGTGRTKEAEPLYREAIKIGEDSLGRDNPDVATRLVNLANLLREAGRTEEAEPLFREAIEIDEKAYGRKHPEVATDLSNLALLLRDTGRYGEAESLLREAIEIGESTLGRDHPHVANRLINLANLLGDTGRAKEAESLFREAIETDAKSFGRNHPEVATNLNYLALLLNKTGRSEEAESLFRKALEIYKLRLGPEHAWVMNVATNLARTLDGLGRPDEAAELRASYNFDDG